jgi:hypothetical protein
MENTIIKPEFIKLLSENPDKVNHLLQSLYDELYGDVIEDKKVRKKKTICHFKAMGKEYKSDIFTKNYEEFMTDVINICGFESLHEIIGNKEISKINNFKHSKKIKDFIFLNTWTNTESKILLVEKVCNELLDCKMIRLKFIS